MLILLSNLSGVPFYKDVSLNDIGVSGFEVDEKGNFYFFGGEKTACLAAFSGDRQLYRKPYREFSGGSKLHLYKNNLYSYLFDANGDPIFIRINVANGSYSKINNSLTSKKHFASSIVDSSIVFEEHGEGRDSIYYEQYSLAGAYIKRALNLYNTPFINLPDKDCEFAGTWNGNYVFWGIPESKVYVEKLWLVDKTGKILASRTLPEGFSGRGYAENPEEDRKVRNGSLYVLGRRGHFALITEVPLQTFFNIH